MEADNDSIQESEVVADSVRVKARNYALLLKPRVMSLVVFTGLVGLILAPGPIEIWVGALTVFLIAVGAGASGAINMWYDRDIDAHMKRTKNRPIPAGRVPANAALLLGTVLSVASVAAMAVYVNELAGLLLAVTIAYYVFIYTMWLKRRTPQNIVIGGAAGAFPPMIGWVAVTGSIDLGSVILFLIIFMWTPPHFWALALYATGDYEKVGVPMLPVVSGVRETKKQIIVYAVLLLPITLVPSFIGMSGWVYGVGAAVLGLLLIHHSIKVWKSEDFAVYRRMFFFSIKYLFSLFVLLLADRAILTYL